MSSTSGSSAQTRLEMEIEQAVELLFDSVTPIVPVFLVTGRESDREQMIQAAQTLLLLYHSDSFNSPRNAEAAVFAMAADSTAASSSSTGSSPDTSSGGSFFAANLALFNNEILEEAKATTPERISNTLDMIEQHCTTMCNLIKEYTQAEQDVSQSADDKKKELFLNRNLIGQEFQFIVGLLNWVRQLSLFRAALHQEFGKLDWTDGANEHRNFIIKFKTAFSEHKTKRTDKMIVGMKKYFVLLKGAMGAVLEARMVLRPESFGVRDLPGLARFCDNLQDRASDREARGRGRGKKRRREVGE